MRSVRHIGPAVAALKKLPIVEAEVAIDHGFAVAIQAAGTAGARQEAARAAGPEAAARADVTAMLAVATA